MCNVLSLSTPYLQNVYIWNTVLNSLQEKEWTVTDILLNSDISETVQNIIVILMSFDIWNEKEWTGTGHYILQVKINQKADLSWDSWCNSVLWLDCLSRPVLWLAWWTFNKWISKVETHTNRLIWYLIDCWTASFAVKKTT